ncbi:MAG: oligosaccharide flippase family protein [Sphingobacteriaceae bacterium]|nr:oligosaccharide flippase family protein [Sphingobacteriaceae bacterium]
MSNATAKDLFLRIKTYLSDDAIKKVVTYSFFGLLPILSGFILTPFYTRFLSQEEYGELSYFNILQGYAALIVILGIDASVSRYYFEFKRNDRVLKEMFASAFQFMLFFSFLACCAVFFIKSFLNHDIPDTIYMAIIGTTLFTVIVVTFINYHRDNQNLNKFIVYSVLLFVIMSISSLSGILFISKDAEGCIYGRLLGMLLLALGVATINYRFFFQKFSVKLFTKLMLFDFLHPLFSHWGHLRFVRPIHDRKDLHFKRSSHL